MLSRTIINHLDFNTMSLHNDISLVRLPKHIILNHFIRPVIIPRRSLAANNFVGQAVQVSGWGRINDTITSISIELNFVNTIIISNRRCARTYGPNIIPSTICASGAEGRSPCHGDSGSPMVIRHGRFFTQVGVVNFMNRAGCASGSPSGYARVTSFLDWISNKTGIFIPN